MARYGSSRPATRTSPVLRSSVPYERTNRSISPLPAIPVRVARLRIRPVHFYTYDADVEDSLERLTAEILACRTCPRLVAWREQIGRDKRAAFMDSEYWAHPIT